MNARLLRLRKRTKQCRRGRVSGLLFFFTFARLSLPTLLLALDHVGRRGKRGKRKRESKRRKRKTAESRPFPPPSVALSIGSEAYGKGLHVKAGSEGNARFYDHLWRVRCANRTMREGEPPAAAVRRESSKEEEEEKQEEEEKTTTSLFVPFSSSDFLSLSNNNSSTTKTTTATRP